MVEAVRRGNSFRAVARQFRVSLRTVQKWVERARGKRLDRVDFSTHSTRPIRIARKTETTIEQRILSLRTELRQQSALGEYGAAAIRRHLIDSAEIAEAAVPSERTINRILERHGVFDRTRRIRRAPPPLGWYLPEVAATDAELDSIDLVEGLALRGGTQIEVLNLTSLHGGLVNSWPHSGPTRAVMVVECLLEHWREFGLPSYAQFDNDTRFQGPHQHSDVISRVMRLCLSLRVTPVFAVPREHGFQNAIESYNARWQAKVWLRFEHTSEQALAVASGHYVDAVRQRSAARLDAAPTRRALPNNWTLDLQKHPTGRVIFLRRTSEQGRVALLGHSFDVSSTWVHRLVRCEIDLTKHRISIYALRRSQPEHQPLLAEHVYRLPKKPFQE
jgi:hypothetical protein